MRSLRLIAVLLVMPLATGCTSATIGIIKVSAAMIGCAYMVCKVSEEKSSSVVRNSAPQSVPRQPPTYQPIRTAKVRSPADVTSLLNSAMRSYQHFEYQAVIKTTSHGLSVAVTHDDRARLLVLRGAAHYLLNDLTQAKSDFTAAKQEGAQLMDSKMFPQDMIEFFNRSR